MCSLGGAFCDGFSKGLKAHLVCHCLLIETDRDGLVLVDTGFGRQDTHAPGSRLSGFFRALNNIQNRNDLTALSQIKALGFRAEDVRQIILMPLDFDHAGGLTDFPQARLHLLQQKVDPPSVIAGCHVSATAPDNGAESATERPGSRGERGRLVLRRLIACVTCRRRVCWCRCRAIRLVTPVLRFSSPMAGCCTAAMPGFYRGEMRQSTR
ncbi:MBL fold metallo-hydrolase [Pantoea sp. AS142]|uniref:MBL fold metallo-hydrolase n=1 Tax=Pantoea sp. AS142 TaxID=3081292 RepID=UPI0030185ABD